MNVFRTFWLSLKDLFDELFILALVNLLWVFINGTLATMTIWLLGAGAYLTALLAALACLFTLGPTTAGLYSVAQHIIEGRATTWSTFFSGLRQYARLSWRVYGLWSIGLLLIITNIRFYNHIPTNTGLFLSILFLYLLLVWLAICIYIGPLMLIQEDKRLHLIVRNAVLMALGRPFFTFITLVMMLAIGLLSLWLLFLPIALTFSFFTLWSFRATELLITEATARRAALDQQTISHDTDTEKGRRGQARPRD